jgi:hypothetical protein
LAVSFVALTVISRTLQSRAINQVQNTASVISNSEFALNPTILRSVHQLTGADVITYTRQGAILATTFDERAETALISAIATSAAADEAYKSPGRVFVHSVQCAAPCFVAYTT